MRLTFVILGVTLLYVYSIERTRDVPAPAIEVQSPATLVRCTVSVYCAKEETYRDLAACDIGSMQQAKSLGEDEYFTCVLGIVE